MNIFEKRENYLPFEYPDVMQFVDKMNQSFWVHTEVNFHADTQDFHSSMSEVERMAVKRAVLSIAQVEVAVKTFWGKLYDIFPKPEINNVGSTHAESETRHSEAYSQLLKVLGLEDEFFKLMEVPIFKERYGLMNKYLDDTDLDNSVAKLLFFTLVVENASLFSQFATVLSMTHFKGLMKNTSNVIGWTSIDEQVHANTGIWLIRTIVEEGHTDLAELQRDVEQFLPNYIRLEEELLDWIFEYGELEFFSKKDLSNYMKWRIDESLYKIGLNPVFQTTLEQSKPLQWFEDEVFADSLDDFFAKRPTEYTKHDKIVTGSSIF